MNLIARIEDVTLKIIEQISTGRSPRISYSSKQSITVESNLDQENASQSVCSIDSGKYTMFLDRPSSNLVESQDIDEEEDTQCSGKTTVDFAMKRSRDKFVLMMTVMAEAHYLLLTNTTKTRRSFYYDLKTEEMEHLVPNQKYVDRAVNNVASLLECAPWDLSESPII